MKKIITLLVCFSLFFNLFTPIKAYVSGGESLTMLIPIVLIFFYDKMFARKQVIGVSIVVLIYFFLSLIGVEYFKVVIPKSLVLLFTVFGLEHFFVTRDIWYVRMVIATVYFSLLILILASIPQFILLPNLTRMMNQAADDPSIDFHYYWTISYETVHFLPVLSIPLFAGLRILKRWGKIIALVGLILMMVVMVLASSTTSLILLVLTYLFFIFYNSKNTFSTNIVKFAVLGVLFAPVLNTSVQLSILDAVQPIFEGSNTSKKIDEIKIYVAYGNTTGDMEARESIYQKTIDGIISNPLFPEKSNSRIGQHSYLLDHLSAMGLFLFIPFALFLFGRFRRILKLLPNFRLYTTTAFVSFIILASFKNIFAITSTLFIVPLAMVLLDNQFYN